MQKLNVVYIGNCSEEFSKVLDSFNEDMSSVVCVCDSDIKRGLICVEKYLCSFVEDYHVLLSRTNVDLAVIESCGVLRSAEIRAAAEAGKNLFVILDESTLMQVGEVEKVVKKAQEEQGIRATFVTVDELDNDFWSNLPFRREDLGRLLNVVVELPSRAPGSVSMNRNAYDAVRTIYELLGAPVNCTGIRGRMADDLFTGAAMYRYADGAIASILVGGGVRAHSVCLYGDQGCAFINRESTQYRLKEGDWQNQDIESQRRRTRKPTYELLQSIMNDDHRAISHSLEEVIATGRMLCSILKPET